MRHLPRVIALLCVLVATRAWAQAEVITDVQVKGSARTEEQTVRSIAGIKIGDSMYPTTLDSARERLHTSGMFASVNVYWEPHGIGVRVVIVVKDKFPWAPLPMFSFSLSEISGGGVLVHGNLFGRGKRGLIGGRLSTVNSGAVAAYDDPAVLGSWAFFTLKGKYQWQNIPEYGNNEKDYPDLQLKPMRNTTLRTYGFDLNVGVAWFRRVRTAVGWSIEQNDVRSSLPDLSNAHAVDLPEAAEGKRRGAATASLTFDFRARERAVMYGNSLGFAMEYGSRRFGNQSDLWYWKASAGYEHGIRFFRAHNLIVRVGGVVGENLPLWAENSAGGTNLRGYPYRQFQGDSHLSSQIEYHFPLFSMWALDVRGLVFGDSAALWWRQLPPTDDGVTYRPRSDGRQYLPLAYLRQGFRADRDIHTSAGAGLRFYLRTVSIPLLGVDVGHGLNGIGLKEYNVILLLGV